MKKADPVIVGIVVFGLVILAGIVLAMVRSQVPPVVQYRPGDSDKPKLEIGPTRFDFGSTSLSEVKTKDIIIKNSGSRSLVFSEAVTSCDCTFVQLVTNGKEGTRFSMQRDLAWRQELGPGEEGIIRVTYEPRLMPVKGRVSRQVSLKTNDPENTSINISFTAEVR